MIILVYVGIFPLGKVYTSLPLMFKNWIGKAIVHLHNGILHSREKEGTPTLCNNMDGTGKHPAK